MYLYPANVDYALVEREVLRAAAPKALPMEKMGLPEAGFFYLNGKMREEFENEFYGHFRKRAFEEKKGCFRTQPPPAT